MMLSVSDRGLALIREYEGFAPAMYLCPAGKATIGYGHMVSEGEDFSERTITHAQAEALLRSDVAEVENAVNRLIEAKLTQNQFDALVSFTFNLGAAALARSTMRKCLNEGKYEYIAKEMMRWVYADGKVLDGLVRRRAAECKLFLEK